MSNKNHYTLDAGRCITRDGVPIATIHRVGSDTKGYPLTPWEADELARNIVRALNDVPALLKAASQALVEIDAYLDYASDDQDMALAAVALRMEIHKYDIETGV